MPENSMVPIVRTAPRNGVKPILAGVTCKGCESRTRAFLTVML